MHAAPAVGPGVETCSAIILLRLIGTAGTIFFLFNCAHAVGEYNTLQEAYRQNECFIIIVSLYIYGSELIFHE